MTEMKNFPSYVLLGARASGKTTYLTVLYAEEPTISANNTQTIAYLKDEWQFLKDGRDHPTRLMLRELSFLYQKNDLKVSFSIDDYDGYFAESLGTIQTQDQNSIHGLTERTLLKQKIKNADGLLLLFPYEIQLSPETSQNFRNEINTYIQLINEIYPHQTKLPTPVVLAVTKWDTSPYYQHTEEIYYATSYLESIDVFRQAKEQIENFFASVFVIPIACFQATQTNTRQKNHQSLAPYNLTKPFDVFLETRFQSLVNHINTLKKDNSPSSLQALYSSLLPLPNSLYRQKLETSLSLKSLLQNTEQQYFQYILSLLSKAPSLQAQKNILSQHNTFCTSTNLQHKQKIELILKQRKLKTIRRRVALSSLVTASLFMIGMVIVSFLWLKKESIAFSEATQTSVDIPLEQHLIKTQHYLKHYPPTSTVSLFLGTIRDFSERYASVTQHKRRLLIKLDEKFTQEFSQILDSLKSPSLENVAEIYQRIALLEQKTANFPQLPIISKIKQRHKILRKQEEDAVKIDLSIILLEAAIKNKSEDLTLEDIKEFEESLKKLQTFSSSDSPFVRKRLPRLQALTTAIPPYIQQTKQQIQQRRKNRLKKQAESSLAIKTDDTDLLQILLQNLNAFLQDPEVEVLYNQISEHLKKVRLNQRFEELYHFLLGKNTIQDLRSSIEKSWPNQGFSEEQRARLHILLDGKISGIDFQVIRSLSQEVSSTQKLTEIEGILNILDNNLIQIPLIDYIYNARTPEQTKQIQTIRQKAIRYRQALDQGLVIREIRLTIDGRTNPLGIYCPTRGTSEGQITILQKTFDQKTAVCELRTTKQIMRWTTELSFSLGKYPFEIRERDTFLAGEDDVLNTEIEIRHREIFQLLNTGLVQFSLLGKYALTLLTHE